MFILNNVYHVTSSDHSMFSDDLCFDLDKLKQLSEIASPYAIAIRVQTFKNSNTDERTCAGGITTEPNYVHINYQSDNITGLDRYCCHDLDTAIAFMKSFIGKIAIAKHSKKRDAVHNAFRSQCFAESKAEKEAIALAKPRVNFSRSVNPSDRVFTQQDLEILNTAIKNDKYFNLIPDQMYFEFWYRDQTAIALRHISKPSNAIAVLSMQYFNSLFCDPIYDSSPLFRNLSTLKSLLG